MRRFVVILLMWIGLATAFRPSIAAQQAASVMPQSARKALTVQRIYSDPSLNGHLYAGMAWSPDGQRISFVKEVEHEGKAIWTIDTASGSSKVLVPSDKPTELLPPSPRNATQATGLGRRAASLYQWAPHGSALLLQSPTSLVWFDLKTQAGRTLVFGKEDIADPKISPDGQYVSFVRDHNLWLATVADGTVQAL